MKIDMDENERDRKAEIVNRDYEGIIPYCEVFYLHSIYYSASRCLYSFEQYSHFKNQEILPDDLISIVQEAVGHSAALSRYFWPSPTGKKGHQKTLKEKRGSKLRNFFKLTEESVLHNRALRNAWEHFDERLDKYLLDQMAGQFFPDCIIDSHTLVDEPTAHIFKLLDVDEECLVLMNTKYFFRPIIQEVEQILYKTVETLNNGGRI